MSAPLPTRQLGITDIHISLVGFGAWATGGDWFYGWGPQDDEESITAIEHALELGVNWIDTAPIYGLGHSEEVVGQFLKGRGSGDRPYIFTKCGMVWDEDDRMKEPIRTLRPDSIRRECEASLRRLGVEAIDLYQFHWPDEHSTPLEDSWHTMVRLVEEGKVRAIGVSNFDYELLEECEAIRHVDSLQPPFSLIRRNVGETEIPWCKAHGTGVICYSPMQSGILTDSFSTKRVERMAEGDWRRRSGNFQSPKLETNIALRDALKPIARRHGTTVASVAIAWVLAWPGVTAAIVGARSPQQVDGWIDAARLTLNAGDLDEIASAIGETGAGQGPTRPARFQGTADAPAHSMEAR
jgi:aryl-alcohol dehydrogenase-like predicted oxidoreductase